jgi:hypothetical protein
MATSDPLLPSHPASMHERRIRFAQPIADANGECTVILSEGSNPLDVLRLRLRTGASLSR